MRIYLQFRGHLGASGGLYKTDTLRGIVGYLSPSREFFVLST
ncbi:hypothetical protein RSAG8_13940, partial [Rhizoctonia solani AG-8 WAC10335]